jgi:hypothetical protein
MGPPRAPLPASRIHNSAIRCTFLLVLGLSPAACTTSAPSVPRYIVTATPLNLVDPRHPGICLGVDPADAQGVWWWEPGPSGGCAKRTTGPTVFRAHFATVAASRVPGEIEVRFQLPLMSGPRDVRLLLQDGNMRVAGSDERVSTARRDDLDIPPFHHR